MANPEDQAKKILGASAAADLIAQTLMTIHRSFIKSGFSEGQALELTKIQYQNIIEQGNRKAMEMRQKI